MVFDGVVLTAIYGRMAEPSPLSGFKAEKKQSKTFVPWRPAFGAIKGLAVRILVFPSMPKKSPF
jgi:hypothetical protein